MPITGPIVLIEDDPDDKDFFEEALAELKLPNLLRWFDNPAAARRYLQNSEEVPFLIVCDVNLPGQNGLEFKKSIDSIPAIRKKSIPFIFLSTDASKDVVSESYLELNAHGYFQKVGYKELKTLLKTILSYWLKSQHIQC
jgi:CheY-like chemotaxis protein